MATSRGLAGMQENGRLGASTPWPVNPSPGQGNKTVKGASVLAPHGPARRALQLCVDGTGSVVGVDGLKAVRCVLTRLLGCCQILHSRLCVPARPRSSSCRRPSCTAPSRLPAATSSSPRLPVWHLPIIALCTTRARTPFSSPLCLPLRLASGTAVRRGGASSGCVASVLPPFFSRASIPDNLGVPVS